MRTLAIKPWTVVKLGACAIVLAVAALGLGRESQPANATEPTRMFISSVDFAPLELGSGIILYPSGPGMELTFWAENVVSDYGAGSFSVDISYISWLLHVNSVADGDPNDGMEWDDEWLSNGGTQTVFCTAPHIRNNVGSGQGEAYMGCSITGTPSSPPSPPWGALGDGILGSVFITPGPTKAITQITMGNTWLKDTGEQIDVNGDTIFDPNDDILVEPDFIPTKVVSLPVSIISCPDFSSATPGEPDGQVTVQDILFEAGKFGATSEDPDWNPAWDQNLDDFVTIPDVLIVARQFGIVCP